MCFPFEDPTIPDPEALRAQRRRAAEDAFAEYCFDSVVSDTTHWEGVTTDEWARIVTAYDDEEEGDLLRLSFKVRFFPGSATVMEAYALDMDTGAEVGSSDL
jgi:hypothetical protein